MSPVDAPEKTATLYPIMLTPHFFIGRTVLVIGGGKVAERKVKNLLAAQAKVRLIAPNLTETLQDLAEAGQLEWLPRKWQHGDVANYPTALLTFAATDDPVVNQQVTEEARDAGRLVNRADSLEKSDFVLPGVVHSGEITLAVATGVFGGAESESAASPALTAHLKQRLKEAIGEEYSQLAKLLRELRPLVKAKVVAEQRPALWQTLIHSHALELLKEGREEEAHQLLLSLIDKFVNKEK